MTDLFTRFVGCWHMSLLFFLAGVGTYYALRKRDAKAFRKERFYRLFVPLVFGTFVVVPFQPYFRRLQEGTFEGNFFAFYPKFFEGIHPEGNLSYSHLWFLLYLFIFAMVCLPLFTTVYQTHGDAIGARLTRLASKRGGLLLLCAPLFITEATLRPIFPGLQTFVTDWANVLRYSLLYTYGFYYVATPGLAQAVGQQRRIWLTVAVITTVVLVTLLLLGLLDAVGLPAMLLLMGVYNGFAMWAWLLTLLGYAQHNLNFDNAILRRFTPISLPFYIVHQTVLIAIGYYVLRAGFSLYPAFITIVALTFVASWLLADFGIRPWGVSRLCFGMKGKLGQHL
jgi:peptidoglycan/LPS O-acetylase OafA/YrhL